MILLCLFSISLAQAAETGSAANLKETLSKRLGDVTQVNKTAIAGMYEVVSQDHIFYADESGQYLIDGNLFDLKTHRNITEARARKLFAVDFSKLPLELAVKKVKGNGSRKLAYFTDPNCGWCKKLEHELQNVNDVTLYLFISTHIGGPDSAEKAQGVWCSADKTKAWDNLMLNGVKPAAGQCETPTDKVMALAEKLKVNGTPALIFANGVINPGFMPAAELNKALDSNK
jgi:thiol:disulfide interchange protein DsbC